MTKSNDTEKLVFVTTTHWMKYIPKIIHAFFLIVVGFIFCVVAYIAISFSIEFGLTFFLIGGGLILVGHHYFWHLIWSEAMQDIIVTNQRIIYFNDCLFFCNDAHEIPLWKVAAVEVQQRGLIQNVLDYGVLWFDTGGGTVDLKRTIPYTPHPEKIADKITDLLGESYGRSNNGNLEE